MAEASPPLPRLPSCQLCYQRKTKCDNLRPKCRACTKSGVECVIVIPESGDRISREAIHDLEQRLHGVSVARTSPQTELTPNVTPLPISPESRTSHLTDVPSNHETTEASGFSFLTPLFANPDWRQNNAHLLQDNRRGVEISESTVRANQLPSPQVGRELFDKYLNGSHVQNPFILRSDIEQLYGRVFGPETAPNQHAAHDLFRAFMILSIGSIVPFRAGAFSSHPFGYYLAAMQHFDSDFLTEGLQAIQDLLLIGRFAIYHHIGTSIWEITQLCVRMCIELGMHLPRDSPSSLLQEQLERRVFWECYMIDRYSSNTLDRPFAITESDIRVGFPADADDEEISAAAALFPDLDSFRAHHSPPSLNEMSVFFLCVRLRQISSQVPVKISKYVGAKGRASPDSKQDLLASGRLYVAVDELLSDLTAWRNSAPIFETPRCLYERQEWYDLLYERERLQIIRRALDSAPKRQGIPPKDLLVECTKSAIRAIQLFSDGFQRGIVTYTRSYFSLVFTAGLSILFCVSVRTPLDHEGIQSALSSLVQCEDCLRKMGSYLPDAKHYAIAFGALCRDTLKKLTDQTPSRDETVRRMPIDAEEPTSTHYSEGLAQSSAQDINLFNHTQPTQSSFNPLTSDADPTHSSSAPHLQNSTVNYWSLPLGHDGSNYSQIATEQALLFSLENDPLQPPILNDDFLWNMEAGLGEYAYGDPTAGNFFFPNIES